MSSATRFLAPRQLLLPVVVSMEEDLPLPQLVAAFGSLLIGSFFQRQHLSQLLFQLVVASRSQLQRLSQLLPGVVSIGENHLRRHKLQHQ
jgi:hypothetical protein